jgi:hypothetical protein
VDPVGVSRLQNGHAGLGMDFFAVDLEINHR